MRGMLLCGISSIAKSTKPHIYVVAHLAFSLMGHHTYLYSTQIIEMCPISGERLPIRPIHAIVKFA